MGEPAYQLPEDDNYEPTEENAVEPLFGISDQESNPRLGVYDGGGESTPRKRGHLSTVPNAKTGLNPSDSTKGTDKKPSGEAMGAGALQAAEGVAKLGKGFSGPEGAVASSLSKFFKSKRARRGAIAGGSAGGIVTIVIVMFMTLIPLKIESLIANLEEHFGAGSSKAMDTMSENMFNAWIRRDIVNNLGKGACRNTISNGCVSVDPDDGPMGRMFNAWRDGKVEQKLANEYDIVLGRKGGTFYIDMPQGNASIKASDEQAFKDGKLDIFTLAEKDENYKKLKVSRNDIRHAFSEHLKTLTLSDRLYDRFVVGSYLARKYGIKRCIIRCDAQNDFRDKVDDKKKFAKSIIIERVIQPLSSNYAFLATCIMEGGGGDCDTNSSTANSSDEEKSSPGQRKVRQLTNDLIGKIGKEAAGDLAKKAETIAGEGLQRYIAQRITSSVVGFIAGAGAGETAAKAATDSIPFVGWAIFIAQMASTAQTIGPMITYIGYAVKATAATQIFYTYATAADETKSGQVDATELGSLTTALGSNLSGSTEDRSDATQTPLYQEINGTKSSASKIALLPMGSASAATSKNNSGYLCNDGKPPSSIVCPEEVLTDVSSGAEVVAKGSKWYGAYLSLFPGLSELVKIINYIGNLPGKLIGGLIKHLPLDGACGLVPGCDGAKSYVESHAAELMQYLLDKVIQNPVTDNMSGGRIYDMMAAGADVSSNQSCQVQLGCARISDETAAAIRTEHIATVKKDFQSKPLFARMFSTDTPYSLVSRLALAMPSNADSMRNQVTSSLTQNPFKTLSSMLAAAFTSRSVFADDSISTKDFFGIIQRGYGDNQIPNNPDQFWAENCVNGPLGIYDKDANTLDVSLWLNAQPQDPTTGEAIPDAPNACLLIYNGIITNGGKYDPSLIPAKDLSSSTTATTAAGSFNFATFNLLNVDNHEGDSAAIAFGCSKKSPGTCLEKCRAIGDPYCIEKRAELQAQFIKGSADTPAIDIIATQETSPRQYRKLTSLLGSDYAGVPDNENDINRMTNQENGGDSIIWNATKFTKVSEGKFRNISNVANKGKNMGYITAPYVVLTPTGSTQKIYVTSIHYPTSDYGGTPEKIKEASQLTMDWVRSVKANDPSAIILIGGDFNDRPSQKLSYCVYTGSGLMQNAYDLQKGNSGQCPSPNDHGSGFGGIDNLYINQNSPLTAKGLTHVARTGIFNNASDHEPVYVTLSFPESGSSEMAGDFAWPVDKKWWNNYRSDFLGGHVMYSGTFTSPYEKGVADDISMPPVGTPIYSMLTGKVIKTNLCGEGDGMMIESKIQGGTLDIAYGHGLSPKYQVGDTVDAGQQILSLNGVGCKVSGPHVHIDMSFNGQHVCPQDVFLAMGSNQTPDLAALTKKASAPCAR